MMGFLWKDTYRHLESRVPYVGGRSGFLLKDQSLDEA